MQTFLSESQIYRLLDQHNFTAPKFQSCKTCDSIDTSLFKEGEKIVIKAEVEDIFHKSDIGLVQMVSFSKSETKKLFEKWQNQFGEKFKSLLLIEKVSFRGISGFPSEIFLSIRKEYSYGHVARLGIGGIHSEFWGTRNPPIIITASQNVKDVLEQLSFHIMGHLWFGLLRQQEALVDVTLAKQFIQSILTLLKSETLPDLLEINPLVVTNDDRIVALDGVGINYNESSCSAIRDLSSKSLLNPKTIAIAGVSTKKESFGNMILKNVINSDLGLENVKVIKEGIEQFEGVECIADITQLRSTPVSNLILALPPQGCISVIEELCEQSGGADIVYLVAGGIGDGADNSGIADKLNSFLDNRRSQNLWVPQLIGPNSLGIINSTINLNTLFIPKHKLDVNFSKNGNCAFLSQSGAFFITRLSNLKELPVKYAFCIGNQIDLTMGEILQVCAEDSDLKVFSIYLEGLIEGDLSRLERVIKSLCSDGKKVIVYKGGKSEEGAKAAAGHTGAIAGSFEFEHFILSNAGAIVCNSIEMFSQKSLFYSKSFSQIDTLGVISNAGYETVCAADIFDKKMITLSPATLSKMDELFNEFSLGHLVHATNPLDLTPMANEEVYLKSSQLMIKDVDMLVVSLIPLTERLETSGEIAQKFAHNLKELETMSNKPIIVVVDSGEQYDTYRKIFTNSGLITFNSIEKVNSLI